MAKCDCRRLINERLSKHNAKMAEGLSIVGPSLVTTPPFIVLEKVDHKIRKKLPHLIATYCPFCGVKYEDEP